MKVNNRVAPNEFNRQRIRDGVPECDHLTITTQIGFAFQALTKAEQKKSYALTYCSRCGQRIRVTLREGSLPEVSELADE